MHFWRSFEGGVDLDCCSISQRKERDVETAKRSPTAEGKPLNISFGDAQPTHPLLVF
jgi:hypothetical protein